MGFILFLNFCGNALIGLAYISGGKGIHGAISSFLGAVQAIINYAFEARGKKLPIWLVIIYALGFVGVNVWVGELSWGTVLAILACMCSVMSLVQKSGGKYRFWALGNNGIWSIYDILSQAYGGLIIHLVLFICTVTGIILYDRKSADKEESKDCEKTA